MELLKLNNLEHGFIRCVFLQSIQREMLYGKICSILREKSERPRSGTQCSVPVRCAPILFPVRKNKVNTGSHSPLCGFCRAYYHFLVLPKNSPCVGGPIPPLVPEGNKQHKLVIYNEETMFSAIWIITTEARGEQQFNHRNL